MGLKTITAVSTTDLGDAGTGVTNWKTIHLQGSTWTGSITVQGRLKGSAKTFVPIPYTKYYLNGAVGDGTVVSTAITADSIIAVDATGLEVRLNCTAQSAGTMSVEWDDSLTG